MTPPLRVDAQLVDSELRPSHTRNDAEIPFGVRALLSRGVPHSGASRKPARRRIELVESASDCTVSTRLAFIDAKSAYGFRRAIGHCSICSGRKRSEVITSR